MSVKKELMEAAGIKAKVAEKPQAFLKRLQAKVDELGDDAWDKLSKPAQDWANSAAQAAKDGADIPALPGESAGGETGGADKAGKPAASKKSGAKAADKPGDKKSAAKKAAKAPDPKSGGSKKAASAGTVSGGENGIKFRIKTFLVKKPQSSVEDIMSKLDDKGEKLSRVTVAAVRSEFRHTVKVLNAAGLTKIEL